jgi:flagellar basal-body rod protein FlgF
MLKGIFSTLTGKYIAQRRLEMVSNNIANSLTPGYKTSRPVLGNIVKNQDSTVGQDLGNSHVDLLDSYIRFSGAPLVQSGAVFDVAVEGEGFFVVSTKNGNMYTRNGQFTLNQEKRLVTMDGNPVLGQGGGEITIDGKSTAIENDGSIFVDQQFVDRIKVVDFKQKTDLRSAGRSLFVNVSDRNEEATPERFSVKQGYYEASNVDVMNELIEMISTLRAYESYTKVDQFFSDIMSKLMDLGKL